MAAELRILITAQNQAKAILGDLQNDLEKTGGSAGRLGGMLKAGLVAGVAAAGAAVAGLTAVLASSVQAASEAEDIQTQLNSVLTSTGGVAGMTADAINSMALELSKVTKFEDDTIVKSSALLLTFTKIGQDVFPQAQEAILNVAQAMGTDLQSATVMVGKALNDPIAGITAMSRAGIQFSDEQKETIKTMVEMGNTAGAQALILKELETQFGGSARAAGQTFSGQLTILKNQLGNVKEEIGGALIPVLTELLRDVGPKIIAIAEKFADWVIAKLLPGLLKLKNWVLGAGQAFSEFGERIQKTLQRFKGVSDFIEDAIKLFKDFGRYLRALVEDGDNATEWLSRLPKWAQPIASAIGTVVKVIRDLVTSFMPFVNAVKAFLSGDSALMRDWLMEVAPRFRDLAASALDAFGKFKEGFQKVVDVFNSTDGTVFQKLGAALGEAWRQITTWWDEHGAEMVSTTLAKLWQWILDTAASIGEKAVEWGGVLKEKMGEAWNSLHKWWDDHGQEWVITTAGKIKEWVTKAVADVKLGVQDLWANFKLWVASIDWTEVHNKIVEIGNQVRDTINQWLATPEEQDKIARMLGGHLRDILLLAGKYALTGGEATPKAEDASTFADQFTAALKTGMGGKAQAFVSSMLDEAFSQGIRDWANSTIFSRPQWQIDFTNAIRSIFSLPPEEENGGGRGAGLQSLAQDTGGALDGLKEAAVRVRDFLAGGWKTTLSDTWAFLRDSLRPQIVGMTTLDLPMLTTVASMTSVAWRTLFDAALRSTALFVSTTLLPVLVSLDVQLASNLTAAVVTAQGAIANLRGDFEAITSTVNNTTAAVWDLINAISSIPSIPGDGRTTIESGRAPLAAAALAGGGGRSVSIIVSGNTFGNRSDVDYMLDRLDRRLRLEGGVLPL